jgi:MoxR-like ATPase
MFYVREVKIPRDRFDISPLGRDHPADYKPDAGLVDAVNVALLLNRPLLLTGEPGTGKTQLAYSVAWQLAGSGQLNVSSPQVERFEAKSTSVARDLFYSFDTLRRFQAAQLGGSQDNRDYITYNALGVAVLRALPREQVAAYLPRDVRHAGQVRSVVLIDEIDKAPRDFPNDLLNELDQMFFRVPELGNAPIGGTEVQSGEFAPLVFITSNSEKSLPDPFLRRCIYYNIPTPGQEELREILLARLPTLLPGEGTLLQDALTFFHELRQNRGSRTISAPELLQWLTVMLRRGADPKRPSEGRFRGCVCQPGHARQERGGPGAGPGAPRCVPLARGAGGEPSWQPCVAEVTWSRRWI